MGSKVGKSSTRLPVTGAGKTTLLEHILKSNYGLKIAVIINDMSALNIDASLITHHKLIQLQNGCICCTLRGDLLSELATLAKSGAFQYVVIESTGISEPMQVAETFTSEFSRALMDDQEDAAGNGNNEADESEKAILKEIVDLGGLHNVAVLDTTVTVVDSFNFSAEFETVDFLSDRQKKGGEAVPEDDERTIADLMVDQLEFADVIIVNKIDSNAIVTLNPRAKVLTANYSKIDAREIISTNSFDFEQAATSTGRDGYGERGSGKRLAPKPETEEYGISNFVYRRRRPFHPKRLYQLIHDKFVLCQFQVDDDSQHEDDANYENSDADMKDADDKNASLKRRHDGEDDEGDDDNLSAEVLPEQLIKNKNSSPVFSSLIRSKGYIWLATRALQHGEWSQASAMLTIQGGGPWFCVLDDAMWPEDPEVVANIKADFEGKWGDRRQELVVFGKNIDPKRISDEFDQCLLTDNEMATWRNGDALNTDAEEVEEVGNEEDATPNTNEGIIGSNASSTKQQLPNSNSSSKDDGHRHHGNADAHRHGTARSTCGVGGD
ncbi:CobW/HypB/UreG, nucleotide-binding domain-containing protein [Lipomyces starkeyi]|uniref:CobW C-terminal domain-containing protein n=1 Tax=Lipomyces starkeyi NRRL Y-11557 TaxID=675824 RepID=A0A1E3QE48_LIPST|nr:hypothetical protein LIPSTDRAFT_116336 [Lipomyces starkeyi NRRL Y-11557]